MDKPSGSLNSILDFMFERWWWGEGLILEALSKSKDDPPVAGLVRLSDIGMISKQAVLSAMQLTWSPESTHPTADRRSSPQAFGGTIR